MRMIERGRSLKTNLELARKKIVAFFLKTV